MKTLFTALAAFLFLSSSFSQQLITDISPDGKETNTYYESTIKNYNDNFQDVPYHSNPTWVAQRDRQIGGLAFGDYDNDGDLDLAVGCYYSQSYPPINDYENFIFKNNNGILDTLPAWITADERTTTQVRWADVNMDGRPDLLSANGQFQHSTLYLNSAAGLSNTPAWISNDNVWTIDAAFNDIDGDGDLDLAFGNEGISPNPYKPIQMFYNNNGTLSTTPGWSSGDQMITNSVGFADVNNSDLTQHTVTYSATGTGYCYLIPMTPVYKIDVVSINGVSTDNYTYDPINCWLALGFKPAAGAIVDISYTYVKHGDLGASKWVYFESGVYFNNNSVLNTLPGWSNGITAGLKGLGWADIDLDGFMDLGIGGSSTPDYVYKNNNGVLSSTPYWQSGSSNTSVQELLWADVNRDGYPDLAVVHFGNSRVEIFINRGGIIDTNPTWTYITPSSATAIAFGDVNGDGWLDLAVGTAREPVAVFIADPALIPVEMTSFTASLVDKKIILNWNTATEKNNSGFKVERRINNGEWKDIGFVPGSGTTSEPQSYSFIDQPSGNGSYIYRLKQTDYNGSFEYSRPAAVDVVIAYSLQLDQNFPNPFNPETKIRFEIPEGNKPGRVSIKLYDILGSEIATLLNEEKSAGEYEIAFRPDEYGLSSGIYFYTLSSGEVRLTKKLIYSK